MAEPSVVPEPVQAPAHPRRGPALRTARYRLTWAGVAFVLVSGLFVVLAAMALRHEEQLSNEQLTRTLAQLIEEQTTRTLQTVDMRLQLAASGLDLLRASGERDPKAAGAMLGEYLKDLPLVRNFLVIDARGRVMYDATNVMVGRDLSDQPFFVIYRSRPDTGFHVSAPAYSATLGTWTISATRPLHSADGRFAGVIVAGIDPQFFARLWSSPHLAMGGSVALFRDDGVLMVRSPFEASVLGKVLPDMKIFTPPFAGTDEGSFERTSTIDGQPRSFAYRRLADQRAFTVVVGYSKAAMLQRWRNFTDVAMATWGVLSVAILLLCQFMDRTVQRGVRVEDGARLLSERFALATDAAGVGVWDWDLLSDDFYVTPSYFGQLGEAPGAGPTKRDQWLERVHPDDLPSVEAYTTQSRIPDGVPYKHDLRVRHADGSYRWFEVSGQVLARDQEGRATRIAGTRVDIHERKQAEEALRRSEAFNQTTMDSMQAQIAVVDPAGTLIAVNRPCRRFALENGVDARDVDRLCVGANYLEACERSTGASDAAVVARGIRSVLDGSAATFSTEYACHSPDRLRWFILTATPLGGGQSGAVIVHTDTTERKRAEQRLASSEEALRASEFRYRTLFEQAPDGIVIADRHGVFLGVNAGAAQMLAYRPEEMVGLQAIDIVAPEQGGFVAAALEALVAGDGLRREWNLRRKDGSSLVADILATTMPDGNLLATIRDVTQRRKDEEALRGLVREKEALLREVHHRVKNNLQVIHSLLRMEASRDAGAPARQVLRDMQDRVQSMATLHDMLYRAGMFASVDLGAYLRQLCTQAVRAMGARSAAIALRLELDPVQVEMDQAMPCGLIVNELLSNCLKHAFSDGRGGEVRIELHAPDGGPHVMLRVSDTGVGLPSGANSTGSGSLGLRLVSDLAAQLEGRFEIGAGPQAVFTVTFTRNRPRPPSAPLMPAEPESIR